MLVRNIKRHTHCEYALFLLLQSLCYNEKVLSFIRYKVKSADVYF